MLFFTEAILSCAVRNAQCKPGNTLNLLAKHAGYICTNVALRCMYVACEKGLVSGWVEKANQRLWNK